MRIAIGQLWQETNTFNPLPTTRADFEQFGVLRGADMLERMADTNELGGFIQSLRRWPERPEIAGLVRLPAWPAGTATHDTFDWLRREVTDALQAAMPVDAVLLALHGAMVADEVPDVEGEVLAAVRHIIGPHVPLVATLDLHTNVTKRMVQMADVLVLYHTAPHIDVFETGQRGAAVLRRLLIDKVRPVTAYQKVPSVQPAERANTQDPASVSYELRRRLVEMEKNPAVLAAGLATVQPWLDIPELGSMVLVTTAGDEQLARTSCEQFAGYFWQRRKEYLPELTPLTDAVRRAFEQTEGLTVLSDSADSTTSGAPGDSNHVLRELLKYEWPRPALVPLVDPELVESVDRLAPGAKISAMIGGKRDRRFSRPMPLELELVRMFDARFVMSGHLARNLAIDMGRSAVLRKGNVHLLVTTRTGPHFSPAFFQVGGFDPFAASVLIAKSPCGFRAQYQQIARQIMVVQAPGCAPADFWQYEYRQINRPLWPWDEMANWKPAPVIR